ncbi:HepT-like ribonuclease domain-containing protein [Lapillicoccus jejuensis]|uniref:Uncharacterized protein with HEPN domain n=1 Tax=Lapillicoccus jejuensis TaxID=402171 RepID=A0A542DY73_9MICO|nr:HepT-like ribonuclease domain-containing protein [Lapillicoccus jejuensis]TQJ08028.1 uncharacterized protein with HEPN domain [Lapillicoccus jejuensis]
MSRTVDDRIGDILDAVDRCEEYAPRVRSSEIGTMAYDAILRNLAVIGEAVRSLPEEVRSAMPTIPWSSISGLRNVVVHEYFRVDHDLIVALVEKELGELKRALRDYTKE